MGLFDKISYQGLGKGACMTLKADGLTKGTDENKPIKISANDTAKLCDDNDEFAGVVETIDGAGYCTVRLSGMAELVYNGTAPTVGWNELTSAGSGKVKTKSGSPKYRVLNVDSGNKKIWVFIS